MLSSPTNVTLCCSQRTFRLQSTLLVVILFHCLHNPARSLLFTFSFFKIPAMTVCTEGQTSEKKHQVPGQGSQRACLDITQSWQGTSSRGALAQTDSILSGPKKMTGQVTQKSVTENGFQTHRNQTAEFQRLKEAYGQISPHPPFNEWGSGGVSVNSQGHAVADQGLSCTFPDCSFGAFSLHSASSD